MSKEQKMLDSDESSWLWRKFSRFLKRDLELHRKNFHSRIFIVGLGVISFVGGVLLYQKEDAVKKISQEVVDGVDVLIKDVAKDTEYWKQILQDF